MGIRFYCSNGHKLNVKEFQAGRKGICPFCGSKIQIPTHSTRPASKHKGRRLAADGAAADGAQPATAEEEAQVRTDAGVAASARERTGPAPDREGSGPTDGHAVAQQEGAQGEADPADMGGEHEMTIVEDDGAHASPPPVAASCAATAVTTAAAPTATALPAAAPTTTAPTTAAPTAASPAAAPGATAAGCPVQPAAASPAVPIWNAIAAAAVAAPNVAQGGPATTGVMAPAAPGAPPFVNAPPGPAAPADPIAEAPQMIWYVRPPSGGQFGPATGEIMRTWLTEGRVAAESLVWREGWRDWQEAGVVFPQLRVDPALAFLSTVPLNDAVEMPSTLPLPSRQLQKNRRQSKNSEFTIIVLLLLAVLLLFLIFLYVLLQ
jgi:hypothetical protein